MSKEFKKLLVILIVKPWEEQDYNVYIGNCNVVLYVLNLKKCHFLKSHGFGHLFGLFYTLSTIYSIFYIIKFTY